LRNTVCHQREFGSVLGQRLVKSRIVNRDARMAGDRSHDDFGSFIEDARFGVPKKQAAQHILIAPDDWHC
jgi:hypothetical protein